MLSFDARTLLALTAAVVLLGTVGVGCIGDACGHAAADAARLEQASIHASAPPLAAASDAGLALLQDWDALPHLQDNRYEQFSSHHRTPGTLSIEPGGKDFNNFIAGGRSGLPLLLELLDGPDPRGRTPPGYVLASVEDGPGYVSRMFFTRFSLPDLSHGPDFVTSGRLGRFAGEVLRIYVDDFDQPAYVAPLADLGSAVPFTPPLAGRNAAAVTSYVPISFAERLRIELHGLCPLAGYFYHVNVQRSSTPTRTFSPRLAEDPSYTAAADLLARFGQNPNRGWTLLVDDQEFEVPPGAATDILADDTGGTIERLRLVMDEAHPSALRDTRLQILFDEAPSPAVDVPLDAFFGCREQFASFATLPMRVDYDGTTWEAECYLPMPYRQHVRITLRNAGRVGGRVRASIGVDPSLPPEPWGYLHARLRAVEGPQPPGSQFEVLDVAGRGRYVGTFLFAAGNSDPRPGEPRAALNILEGNETGIIDGEVRMRGTGTEDYYNGGFYFAEGPFSHPFSAANYVSGASTAEPGVVSCCRWHVLSDAIDFQRSFVLRFQYAADNPELVVRYATVAYYYHQRPS